VEGRLQAIDYVGLFVCLSLSSTLNSHSTEGAAVSHNTATSCKGRVGLVIVSTYGGDTLDLIRS